jgi:hypothetical protein
MSTTNVTPGSLLKSFNDLAAGLASSPPGGQPAIVIEGQSVPVSTLLAELQGYAIAYQAVEDAEQVYKRAIAARDAVASGAQRRREAIRASIKGTLGRMNPALEAYGMSPDREQRALTAEEEVAKVAKARATRAARHTMGKRQRLAIKGQPTAKEG